jgi:hypothetical protein
MSPHLCLRLLTRLPCVVAVRGLAREGRGGCLAPCRCMRDIWWRLLWRIRVASGRCCCVRRPSSLRVGSVVLRIAALLSVVPTCRMRGLPCLLRSLLPRLVLLPLLAVLLRFRVPIAMLMSVSRRCGGVARVCSVCRRLLQAVRLLCLSCVRTCRVRLLRRVHQMNIHSARSVSAEVVC